MPLLRPLSALCLLLPALALAHDHGTRGHDSHNHGAHEHGAHEHGIGQLDLAVDGNVLEIVLAGPGHNFVGFEHAAQNDAQREAITQARARLQDGATLFGGLGGCQATVELDAPQADEHEHQHEHEHAHAHGKEHEHDKKPGHADGAHGHADGDEHEHEHTHRDWQASYRYTCPDAVPRQLTLGVFSAFPQTLELRWQAVTPTGQTGGVATPQSAVLHLP